MKVALAQINCCVGDLDGNTKKIISAIKKAKLKGVDLLAFPELAVTGYPPEDLLLRESFVAKNLQCLKRIEKVTKGIAVVVGFVSRDKEGLYNSCAIVCDGKIKNIYNKINLPNYGVFDEKRYFAHGDELCIYEFEGRRFCINICEDIWEENFADYLKGQNLDFILNISASPFYVGKVFLRDQVLSRVAKKTKTTLFYCNLVGGQDEIVFDGTSKIFSKDGKLIACAKRFKEDLIVFDFNGKKKYPLKTIKINKEEEVCSAVSLGLHDYIQKNGFKSVAVGVSGGIDSALTLALAVRVLGKENVYGLIMPSQYTSKGTLADAKKICKNLGIKNHIINIESIYTSYEKALKPVFKGKRADVTEENIQARIRGNLLMAFSNKFGALVLNTGNKSEGSCGYCTLYGDMIGGYAPLKDLTKNMVYKLARYINKTSKGDVIPKTTITRAPSAELRLNQKDADSLGPYNLLDPILEYYIEKDLSLEQIVNEGFKRSVVEKVIKMVDSNEYKRRQAPLGVKITQRAFGKDRRMPITNKYRIAT